MVIPNRTLLNATIVNTSLKRVRKIKEKKQKTKDEDNDFDFDMEFMTEKFSAMFAGKKLQKAYLYPLEFILGVSEYSYNKISERFSQVSEKFKEKTLEPISWFVLSRNRQDIKFQLSLIVDDALVLLDLIDEVNDELTKVFSPS